MPACERIIALEPEHAAGLDSRGVARMLTGDLQGALADLRQTVALRDGEEAPELVAKRKAWIAALEVGDNPLVERGYRDSAADPVEQSIEWLLKWDTL